jgi:hypothetical protein
MTPRIQKLLLGGLLLILGTIWILDTFEESSDQFTTRLSTMESQTPGSSTSLFGLKPQERKSSLSAQFTKPRNIFAPLGDDAKPQKILPSKKKTLKPKTNTAPPQMARKGPTRPPTGPSPDELAAQQARQQLSQFRFLGYMIEEGESQVFLSNGQAIYIAKQGETLEGDIVIQAIQPTEVTLSKTLKSNGLTVDATLPLTKEGKGNGA